MGGGGAEQGAPIEQDFFEAGDKVPPPEVVVSILAKKGAQARKLVGNLAVRQNQVHIIQ